MLYLFKILSKLSLQNLYLISAILYYIIYYLLPYRNKIITKNLKIVFNKNNNHWRTQIKKNFYVNFLNIIFEIIKLINLEEKDIIKKIKVKNTQAISKELKKQKSIIILSSHYCNWEWLLARVSICWKEDVYAIYKPLSNNFFNKLILRTREKFGAKMLQMKYTGRFIIKNSQTKNIYFFLSDQVPENITNSYKCFFLGQKTSFSTGVERLSKKNNMPVFYAEMKKINNGLYNVEFSKINHNNITKQYVKKVEKTILEKPEHWLWSHNRWKR